MIHRNAITLFAAACLVLPACAGCKKQVADSANRKMIILGFDGMDPKLAREMLDAGQLPNFAKLESQGGFDALGTSTPPQSPVAWSSLITGTDPGKHGIFDFIHRDPSNYMPYSSTAKSEMAGGFSLPLGKWAIPVWGGGEMINLRQGKPFWEYLTKAGVNAHVYRMPANYPPEDSPGPGEYLALTDMGTPDAKGSIGEFSYYITGAFNVPSGGVSGGKIYRVFVRQGVIDAKLYGPSDALLASSHDPGGSSPPLEVDMTIYRDPEEPSALIEWQGKSLLLKEGEWSDWQTVDFNMGPSLAGAHAAGITGSFRMYLKRVRPGLQLYVTPIQIDPMNPGQPISSPADFAPQVASKIGRYFSQGLPEDTKALTNQVLDRDEFMVQADMIFDERMKLLDFAMDRFEKGFMFFYFGSTDQVAHMFWGTMVESHPGVSDEERQKYHDVVRHTYIRADEALGKVMQRFPDVTLVVVSDHGFMSFSRGLNVNRWLIDNGYATLVEDPRTKQPYEEGRDFLSLDWKKTKAYALGINGLYINLKGRERDGIVPPSEKQQLLDEIAEGLLAVRDPENGQPVVKEVYQSHKVYSPDQLEIAPDIQIGYADGYRASWATALGGSPKDLVEDNLDEWNGDHCVATDLVPGVVFSNRKLKLASPTLEDIAPTILKEFDLPVPQQMRGASLFETRPRQPAAAGK